MAKNNPNAEKSKIKKPSPETRVKKLSVPSEIPKSNRRMQIRTRRVSMA